MLKIKKLILIFIITFISIFSVNAGGYYPEINNEKNYQEINYYNKSLSFGEIKADYNIGFKNEIIEGVNFLPINIKFSEKINGTLNIYKEEFYYSNGGKKGKGEELYKTINLKNTNKLESYFYKGENSYKYYFYLNINNITKKLNIENSEKYYSNELYIINSNKKLNNNISISEITDLFFLKQFDTIFIKKDKLLNLEVEILNDYIYSGGNIVLNENLFKKYFFNNKEVKKIKYSKNCVDYYDCSNGSNSNKNYYNYGFGNIYIENKYRYIQNNDNFFLNNSEIKNILIDKVIESKFVPFNVILYFVIIYFVALLIINFIFGKKLRNNKFFLFYSIPATSIIFLLIIISISIYFKGFNDIENKIQINHHKNNKILKQVYITNFSANGGDYKMIIDKNDYSRNFVNNYGYNNNYTKKEISIENGQITDNITGFNSSGLLYFNYSKVDNNPPLPPTFNTKGGENKVFKTKKELINYLNINNKNSNKNNILNISRIYNYENIKNNSYKIDKIILTEKESKYMKKYSYEGYKNKNLIIDIFYK